MFQLLLCRLGDGQEVDILPSSYFKTFGKQTAYVNTAWQKCRDCREHSSKVHLHDTLENWLPVQINLAFVELEVQATKPILQSSLAIQPLGETCHHLRASLYCKSQEMLDADS